MASGSTSDTRYDNRARASSVAPPRLPLPHGVELPQYQTSSTRPWSSSSSQYSGHRIPDLPSFNLSTTEQQSLLPRHLQLPPLDTSLASHRPLGDQLYAVDFGHHPSKRRRAEQSHRSPSPKLVSRSILNADSSSRVNLGSERIVCFISDLCQNHTNRMFSAPATLFALSRYDP